MLVSIIIPVKNEEKNIEKCLLSIFSQTFFNSEMEILVIDDSSTDKTLEVVETFRNKFDINIKLHKSAKWRERSVQRNCGAEMSQGKYLMYLDADMEISEKVIGECVEKLEKDNDLVALYVPEKIKGNFFWNRVRNFERSFYDDTVIDAARFIRKDIFESVGGFDENLIGPEDWDLDKKIRKIGKMGIIKNRLFHNEGNFSLKKYLKKKAYYSQSFDKYIQKWGERDSDIQKQFGFYYRFVGVFMENGKWKKLFCHPILAAGMYFLRFLVGIVYSRRLAITIFSKLNSNSKNSS